MTPPPYLDTLGRWDAVAATPEQLLATLDQAVEVAPDPGVREVVLLGVGTGRTVGDAVAAYAARHGRVPVTASSHPEAPAFVDARTLVLAISPSGHEAETLAAASDAVGRGADVVLISSADAPWPAGDVLGGATRQVRIPPTPPLARGSVATALAAALALLARAGVVDDVTAELRTAVASLQRRRDALLAPENAADAVARQIGRTMPLVYGEVGLPGVAADYWKSQFNENVKTPAFSGVLPDAAYADVSGWGQHGDITRQVFTLIPLRHAGEHPMVARRFDAVLDAMDEVMAAVVPVWAEGDSDLARFLDLTLFGDFVSLSLAGREGIDPGPVATQPLG